MSLLRIRCSVSDATTHCRWVLIHDARAPVRGEGPLADVPRKADRVQLVLPAGDVLITRAKLPSAARSRAGPVLAYAVEDQTLGEPEDNQVSWVGTAADSDVLAVMNKRGMQRRLEALDGVGIGAYEVHCETLLLPWVDGEWSVAWDGHEGCVRTGALEGAALDYGDQCSPPLTLQLMLEKAAANDALPDAIAIYATEVNAAPDTATWERALGVKLRNAGPWGWDRAPPDAGVSLIRRRRRWRMMPGTGARLRPAAWVALAALAIHALALSADWMRLSNEERALRAQMELSFREAFPEAIAVVDPALQMRRKLAEARHAAGRPDSGDFVPLLARAAGALKALPAASLRIVSYENGRLSLEFPAADEAAVRRTAAQLAQTGMSVDIPENARRPGARVVLMLRAP